MAKGDNMKPLGQRKTLLRKLTNHKDGETAMLATIMFSLMDDLSASERTMWEQAFQHHTRRIKFGEPFQVEKKENGLNLFAGEGA